MCQRLLYKSPSTQPEKSAREARRKIDFHDFKVIRNSNIHTNIDNYYDFVKISSDIPTPSTKLFEGTMSHTHSTSKFDGH